MKTYLETNVFFYLADEKSPQHQACITLVETAKRANFEIITSVETIQEILHWSSVTKNRPHALDLINQTIALVDTLLEINLHTIEILIAKAKKYSLNHSRDLLHLATCLEHNIIEIITYDSAFQNFKEIRAFTPQEYSEVFLADEK